MSDKQNFLDEALSDGERTSFGRLGSFIALWFACVWMTRLVWTLTDFGQLPNLAIFLTACGAFIGVLYGFSKYNDRKEATNAAPPAA
jgi:hypothetical protein